MTSDEKRSAWEYVIGLSQMQGTWEPNKEYMDLVEKEIRGKITTEQMKDILRYLVFSRTVLFTNRLTVFYARLLKR